MPTPTIDEKKIHELVTRGIELGKQRRQLAVEVQTIKAELLKHGVGTAPADAQNSVHAIASAFIGACW